MSRSEGTGPRENGGGLWIGDSDAVLTECTISGNHAGGDGGGVMFGSDNVSKLVGCEITDNSADGNGGGMFTTFCFDWSMTDCTLAGNTAGGSGGAVFAGYDSHLTINQCTIAGNVASDGGGGGIDVSSATMTVASSTISGNSAGEGGGIHNSGTMTLIGSIVAENLADYDPGRQRRHAGRRRLQSDWSLDRRHAAGRTQPGWNIIISARSSFGTAGQLWRADADDAVAGRKSGDRRGRS